MIQNIVIISSRKFTRIAKSDLHNIVTQLQLWIFYCWLSSLTFFYLGFFAWWYEMSDVGKGAIVGGCLVFIIIMIICCCYCCGCCRSNRPTNQGQIIVQPAYVTPVRATSTKSTVPMRPLVNEAWAASCHFWVAFCLFVKKKNKKHWYENEFRLLDHFHANQSLNGFVLRLVLKKRHRGTSRTQKFGFLSAHAC